MEVLFQNLLKRKWLILGIVLALITVGIATGLSIHFTRSSTSKSEPEETVFDNNEWMSTSSLIRTSTSSPTTSNTMGTNTVSNVWRRNCLSESPTSTGNFLPSYLYAILKTESQMSNLGKYFFQHCESFEYKLPLRNIAYITLI